MLKKRIIITVILFISFGQLFSFAQFDPDSLFRVMTQQFEEEHQRFAQQNEAVFNSFVAKNDEEFVKFLKNAWEAYPILPGEKVPKKPKPEDIPRVKSDLVKGLKAKELPVKQKALNENIVPVVLPKDPGVVKTEPNDFPTKEKTFNFYGTKLIFKYDEKLDKRLQGNLNKDLFSQYFSEMSKTYHYHLIEQLRSYKENLSLNDWGYVQMVNKLTEQIIKNDKNSAKLLSWFILIKSRYKVKIGYNNKSVYLLVPTKQILYGKSYFVVNKQKYFLLEKCEGKIFTYKKNYPDAKLIVDLEINYPLNFAKNTKEKEIKFTHEKKNYSFKIKYNKNVIDFYRDYPLSDISVYFNSRVSATTKESLLENLKPIVEHKSKIEAANFLIGFVQKGFSYKTDGQQFGKEKFFFVEELFHYSHSDCEDRSVLFAFLVNELLHLEVAGLGYPRHMATAVNFNGTEGQASYDYIVLGEKKFVVCDPTYVGAPVGLCMPEFAAIQGEIILLENHKAKAFAEKEIWEKIYASGGYHSSKGKDIIRDKNGNYYATGYFTGNARFNTLMLTTTERTNDVFVAKYDANGQLKWVSQTRGKGNNTGIYIALDSQNNCYIAGSFNNDIRIGNTDLKNSARTDFFVAKLNNEGVFQWASKIDMSKAKSKSDHICLAAFDPTGHKAASMLFDENEYFKNHGIRITKDGNCLVSVSYPTSQSELAEAVKITVESAASFNHGNVWKAEYDKLIAENYEQAIAGLFAFIKTIKVNGSSVRGKTIQDALDRYNPDFRKMTPAIYQTIGKIDRMKNTGGIISLTTVNQEDLNFSELRLKNNTRMKITTYKGGNAQITIISGASVGQAVVRMDLNFIKMFKETGDLIFDYDSDHSQKKMNLKKDILN